MTDTSEPITINVKHAPTAVKTDILYSVLSVALHRSSAASFSAWLQTTVGKAWRRKPDTRRPSPYAAGFTLPDWHHSAVKALSSGDCEAMADALLLVDAYSAAQKVS